MAFLMMVTIANAAPVRTPVKVSDLSKAITDNVAKDYVGFTIKSASQVTNDNVITFAVTVTKGTSSETLIYDKDGKFVKKMMHKEGNATHDGAKKPGKNK